MMSIEAKMLPDPITYSNRKEFDEILAQRDTEVVKLTNDLKTAKKTITDLQLEVAMLKKSPSNAASIKEDGSMSYADFQQAVSRQLGGLIHGWQRAFLNQTGISETELRLFIRNDSVPASVVRMLPKLSPVERRHRKRWDSTEKAFLVQKYAADENQSYDKLAELCSKEFGRPITAEDVRLQITYARREKRIL